MLGGVEAGAALVAEVDPIVLVCDVAVAPSLDYGSRMERALLSTKHWLMEADAENRVVWLRRLPLPFASISEIASANEAVIQRIEAAHARWGVIVDLRRAPSRNDPAFESAMRGLRAAVAAGFARTALLLATQAGVLQVSRLAREDGSMSFVTTAEEMALEFARGAPS